MTNSLSLKEFLPLVHTEWNPISDVLRHICRHCRPFPTLVDSVSIKSNALRGLKLVDNPSQEIFFLLPEKLLRQVQR